MGEPHSLLLGLTGFSLGHSGLRFFTKSEFASGQLGYSIGQNGESLVGNEEGDWKPAWQVIGYDESCGDPIFVDTDCEGLPVFTAIHGIGVWTPKRIADTLDAFRQSLQTVSIVAVGREDPVKLEANPIDETLRKKVLDKIGSSNPSSDIEFWELTLGIF